MKKSEIPQDKSALEHFTREVCYVKNEEGKYETGLSEGWDVKKVALDNAWDDIEERIENAKSDIRSGVASPVLYFMEKNLMDIPVLKGYTGFFGWQIKKHLKPSGFRRLSDKKLQKYADVFEISVEELKSYSGK